jgi:recombination protein RecT
MTTSTAIKPLEEISQALTRMEPAFKQALPSHVPVEKLRRVLITAISQNPDLQIADRPSLYNACMKAAQAGLIPDGKEAALVMFKNQVQYMPMVAGILKLVRNSGELSTITSQIVHKNDAFDFYVDGDGEHLLHRPLTFGDRGEKIGVYALAKTKDGAVYIEVMTTAQVMAIKGVSRAQNGPWAGPFAEEMWRKSAIRRLSKRLPMSTDLERVVHADDEMYDLKQAVVAEPTPLVSERLREVVSPTVEIPTVIDEKNVPV